MDKAVNTALKRLLHEAREAPPGTTSLQGENGLTATLEESEFGEARMVRVFQEDREVFWSFPLKPGEEKPQFYPEDLPHLPDPVCNVVWTEKGGLVVFWNPTSSPVPVPLLREYASRLEGLEIPPGMEEILTKAKAVGKETASGLGELLQELAPPSFMARVREATKGLLGEGLPEEVEAMAAVVRAFLEEEGWALVKAPDAPGHFQSWTFSKGTVERHLRAVSLMASSTVLLTEKRDTDA